jgi:transcriptional regulator with XRE-family HTH domain
MTSGSALADFLRARREQVRPADVGLPDSDRRRVAGLRRDEVAMLAGISTEYYLRLEQGRERHPSDQVLQGITRALQLNDDAATYLHGLVRPAPPKAERRTRSKRSVDKGLQTLIDSWPLTPARIQDSSYTVLAANSLSLSVSPMFTPGVNALRTVFLEPEMREYYRDWDALTAQAVPSLRSMVGSESSDPEFVQLIGELSIGSERFRTLWARQGVKQRPAGLIELKHPQVGDLDLHYQQLVLPDSGLILAVFWAEPGSASEEKLRLLASL